jgi:single-strand DNA-binding protein
MARSVSKTILIGHVGKDPESRTLQGGGRVCTFSVATSESWRDKSSGEKREKTEWHNIVVWNEGLIKVCESYLKKGSLVYIEGRNETRKWQDQSGNDRYATEVVLRPYRGELTLLSDGGGNGGGQQRSSAGGGTQQRQQSGQSDDIGDEIPF